MKTLSVAAAQAVSVRGEVDANLVHHCQLAELAIAEAVAVVVFPELSLTGYELDLAEELAFSAQDKRLLPLVDVADASGTILIVGAPVRLSSGLHIGAFVLEPGRTPRVYAKRYLGAGEEAVFLVPCRNSRPGGDLLGSRSFVVRSSDCCDGVSHRGGVRRAKPTVNRDRRSATLC